MRLIALSQQDSETETGFTAAFSRYLRAEMKRTGMKAQDIADRGKISKQLVSRIVNARGGDEPSALAVAGVARALEVEPGEVLRGMGMWDGPNRDPIPHEAAFVYRQLDHTQQQSLVSVARVLREAQMQYEKRLREAYVQGGADALTEIDGTDSNVLDGIFPRVAGPVDTESEAQRDISEGEADPP